MSRPRQVLPERSYLITRRCTQRQLLMRPDAKTNEAFVYCLAVAARRYGIDVLFTVAMSNHHHTGIYDRHGNYPAFLEYFHKLFAKCQNALRGRWENFWSSEQTSVVRLVDPEDILEKLVYSLCNPVESGLVERARQWPGVSSFRATTEGQVLCAKRPEHFFRPDGPMPETASLRFARPEGFHELSGPSWGRLVEERVARKESEFRRARAEKGVRAMGARRVQRQNWWSRPKSPAPKRTLSPRVAARNKWRRIETLLGNRHFFQAYRAAWAALKAGTSGVLFPVGTYWLRRFAHVRCEGLSPSAAV